MDNKEFILQAIALIEYIKEDNLAATKELITWFNNNFQPNNDFPNLNELIPLQEIMSSLSTLNNSLSYAILNIENMYNIEQLKWHFQIIQLINTRNYDEITDFIINCLASENIKDYQIANLIQLSVTVDRYDLLHQIREKVKE